MNETYNLSIPAWIRCQNINDGQVARYYRVRDGAWMTLSYGIFTAEERNPEYYDYILKGESPPDFRTPAWITRHHQGPKLVFKNDHLTWERVDFIDLKGKEDWQELITLNEPIKYDVHCSTSVSNMENYYGEPFNQIINRLKEHRPLLRKIRQGLKDFGFKFIK